MIVLLYALGDSKANERRAETKLAAVKEVESESPSVGEMKAMDDGRNSVNAALSKERSRRIEIENNLTEAKEHIAELQLKLDNAERKFANGMWKV